MHPHCGEIKGEFLINDFAILVLSTGVQLSASVTVAPTYPLADMAQMWRRTTSQQYVCLLVGFGRYTSRIDTTKSSVIRHGWQSLMTYREFYNEFLISQLNITDYLDIVTSSCYQPLLVHKLYTLPAKGDSGSPVTCDNKYFGLNSMYSGVHGILADLIFYAFANSQEYRQMFFEVMLKDEDQPDHLLFFDYLKYLPLHPCSYGICTVGWRRDRNLHLSSLCL